MSNATPALMETTVTRAPLRGMISLRADVTDRDICRIVTRITGTDIPAQRGCVFTGEAGLAWMSPDELLVFCAYDDVSEMVQSLAEALADYHSLVVDMSDARAVFTLSGPDARTALAKLAPVDLSEQAFQPGMIRRTRLAQVPAAFWMTDATTFEVVCFSSVADYVYDLLENALL